MMNRMKWGALLVAALLAAVLVTPPATAQSTAASKVTNSVGVELILIPAGSFQMGGDPNFEDAASDETPRHKVTISKPFYLGKTEVTQEQWVAVMGSNPSQFKGRSNPVERVSWNDVQTFTTRLNAKEGTTRYRLPTEAEWEYAVRAGTTGKYGFGDDEGQLGTYAWFGDNSGNKTHPVAQLHPNAWGLYDMHGNVWEWVQDWYGGQYYASSPSTDPRGPSSGSGRVLRGGSWNFDTGYVRAAFRYDFVPGSRYGILGFRLARSLP